MGGSLIKRTQDTDDPFRMNLLYDVAAVQHWHAETEWFYVLEGSVQVDFADCSKLLHQGDLAQITCGVLHGFSKAQKNTYCLILHAQVSRYSRILDEAAHQSLISGFSGARIFRAEDDSGGAQRMRELILECREQTKPWPQGCALGVLSRVCELIIAASRFPEVGEQIVERSMPSRDVRRLTEQVIAYLDSAFDKSVTLSDCAHLFGYSPSHFSRIFHSQAGIPFSQYLNQVRITKAQFMIRNPDRNITEIAYSCGFSSIASFNRAFKRYALCSPREYREAAKNEQRESRTRKN